MPQKEQIGPLQYSFSIDGTPRSLISVPIPFAETLVTEIRNSKLWPDVSKRGIFISLFDSEVKEVEFDCTTCATKPDLSGKRPGLIAISTPELSGSPEEISERLTSAVTRLGKDGVLYILEEKGQDSEKEWRLGLMADCGLVERSVLVSKENILLWRGRLPKEHVGRTIDLIDVWKHSDEEWKRHGLHDMAVKVSKRFHQAGLKVISWKEIEEHLHATKNPHASIQSLKAGGGLRLQSHCGCEWKTNLSGDIHIDSIYPGCDEHTPGNEHGNPITEKEKNIHAITKQGEHFKEPKPYYVVNRPVELVEKCWCGEHLVEDARIEKRYHNGKIKVLVEKRCPHDGLITTSHKTIESDQLSE